MQTSMCLPLQFALLSMLSLGGCTDDGLTGLADSVQVGADTFTSGPDVPPRTLEDTWVVDGTIEDTPQPDDTGVKDTKPDAKPSGWGDSIQAKPHQWQWIDFPNTFCADGSPTGLGVNLSPGATRALIYFEGGGACWDYASCTGLIETSFHLNGFDEGDFNSLLIDVYKNMLLYDRNEPKNPFADAHHVFIPYCTGDVFSGDNVTEVKGLLPWNKATIHFKGAHNVAEYLKRLAPTFAEISEVYLAGSSAGGFGAGLSWHSARKAFSPIPVHVIDDSGPPIQPKGGLWEAWKKAWNMQFPAECPQCSKGLDEVVAFFQETMLKDAKLAVITYSNDPIISTFLQLAPWDFTAGLEAIFAALDTSNNAHYFVVPGLLHTMLIGQNEIVEGPDGTPLWFWISNMVDDDSNWKSIKP